MHQGRKFSSKPRGNFAPRRVGRSYLPREGSPPPLGKSVLFVLSTVRCSERAISSPRTSGTSMHTARRGCSIFPATFLQPQRPSPRVYHFGTCSIFPSMRITPQRYPSFLPSVRSKTSWPQSTNKSETVSWDEVNLAAVHCVVPKLEANLRTLVPLARNAFIRSMSEA